MKKTVIIAVVALVIVVVFIILLVKQSRSGTSPISPDEIGGSLAEDVAVTGKPPEQSSAPEYDSSPAVVPSNAVEPSLTNPVLPSTQSSRTHKELKLKLPKPQFSGSEPSKGYKGRLGIPRPLFVPAGTELLSGGKKVTSSDSMPTIGGLDLVTDGDKEAFPGCLVELGPGKQWIQIDLGSACIIDAVAIWHAHDKAAVVYRDVVVQVADDADFIINARTVLNNDSDNTLGLGVGKDLEYVETNQGWLIDGGGVRARYIRLYSNGSTGDEYNRYTEVEVYGRKAE